MIFMIFVLRKIAKKLNLDLSMTHDFYKYDQEKNRRTGEFNKNINGTSCFFRIPITMLIMCNRIYKYKSKSN